MNSEFIKSISDNIKERTSSPLFGAFVISWLGWNYRAFVIVFSDLPVGYRFQLLDTMLYPNSRETSLRLLGYPLATAISVLIVYPLLSLVVFWYWRNYQKLLLQIRIRIDNETPLPNDEARLLRRRNDFLQEQTDKEISRRDAEIKDLKVEIQDLRGKLADPGKEEAKSPASAIQEGPQSSASGIQPPPNPWERDDLFVDDRTYQILTALASGQYKYRSAAGISKETKLPEDEVSMKLLWLEQRALVSRNSAQNGPRWFITSRGRLCEPRPKPKSSESEP